MSQPIRTKHFDRLDVTICAWCNRYYDPKTMAIVEVPEDLDERDRFSHGICLECASTVKLEIEEEANEWVLRSKKLGKVLSR